MPPSIPACVPTLAQVTPPRSMLLTVRVPHLARFTPLLTRPDIPASSAMFTPVFKTPIAVPYWKSLNWGSLERECATKSSYRAASRCQAGSPSANALKFFVIGDSFPRTFAETLCMREGAYFDQARNASLATAPKTLSWNTVRSAARIISIAGSRGAPPTISVISRLERDVPAFCNTSAGFT